MARRESEREDLLREATALMERAELRLPDQPESIVAGFRRDGSASFFFGQSPVYQFNTHGELRRAYIGGLLYKADQGKLRELRRQRTETAVELHSSLLSPEQAADFLLGAQSVLSDLHSALAAQRFTLVGQVPDGADVPSRLVAWLAQVPSPLAVAKGPRAG